MTDPRALALKAVDIGIVDADPENGSVYWSPPLCKMLGLTDETEPSLDAYIGCVHPLDRDMVRAAFAGAMRSRQQSMIAISHRIVSKDEEIRWLSLRGQALPVPEGEGARIVFSVMDITEWKEKEEKARHSEAKLSAILAIAPSAIISIDGRQRITLFNEAAEKLFGYRREEIIGRPLDLLIPHRFRRVHGTNVEKFSAGAESTRRMGERQDVAGLRKDGGEFPAEASISKIEIGGERIFTVVLHDISERKAAAEHLVNLNRVLEQRVAERTQDLEVEMKRREEAQKQLIHAQRMEAFGQLTGGIAHDFNNLLAVIGGSLELLEPSVTTAADREHLERAINAAEMGARLTSRLLTFARRRQLEPTILNLNEQVMGLLELLRRTLGEQVILRTSLAQSPWLTRADASEAENAILNLALNARDAMPNGGRLIMETANVTVEEGQAAELKGLAAGDYIRLSVSDTGVGIPKEALHRVFEPFFTTKGTGKGSGLGLSTIYGFATQSGGTVSIYSELGKGTTVHLYLPRVDGSAHGRLEASFDRILFSRNNERVLVVEDNPEVRETTLQRVEGLGYIVSEAATGPEAIEILKKEPDIALVFSDVVMTGGMSGYELGLWIRKNEPGVKVLLTSGFAPEIAAAGPEREFQVLRKPFNRVELSRALSNVLYGPERD
ncbi:MAG TPA: PAS domain S-box protein [Hyphomicrobiales bacterium]|nr:PAS domain S-box protein [Hyphomicrobiales bacterium]